MNITSAVSLAAMFVALTTLVMAIVHWQKTRSKQRKWIRRQQDEIDRLSHNRADLARKFFQQLRQARLYFKLEEEFCVRLAQHTASTPDAVRIMVRLFVEEEVNGGIRGDCHAKESNIQDQSDRIHVMGFESHGDSIAEIGNHLQAPPPMTAA